MNGIIRTYGADIKIENIESITFDIDKSIWGMCVTEATTSTQCEEGTFEKGCVQIYTGYGVSHYYGMDVFTGIKFEELAEITLVKQTERFSPLFFKADALGMHHNWIEFYKEGKIVYTVNPEIIMEIGVEKADVVKYIVKSNDEDFNYIDEEYRTFNTKEEAEEQIKEWEYVDEKEGFEGIHYNIKEVLA